MVKYFDGEQKESSVEAVMNHVNLYLNGKQTGRQNESGVQTEDVLQMHYEQLTEYLAQLNEEFDMMQVRPVVAQRGIKGMVKKVIAKCVGWYMKNINKRQTDFNMHVICALNSERAILEELMKQDRDE